jgi:hypothetical protein
MAGSFQWAFLHNFLARPHFYTLHHFSLIPGYHHVHLSHGTRAGFISAYLLSSLPWTPNDLTLSFPPPSTHLFFCDASIADLSASCTYLSLTGSPLYLC